MDIQKAWDASKHTEKTIKSMNAVQCRDYLARLKWLDDNPIVKPVISDVLELKRKR